MGQCNLSEIESNYLGDLFDSQASEDGSFMSREVITQKDRLMWEHQLKIMQNVQIPARRFWNDEIKYPHPCFQQISKDVTRTFPESSFFGYKQNIDSFEKVLRKTALYFPHVGYTQGLNFVGGYLMLIGCQQEECYNLLVRMMVHDKILAIGLFEDGFPLSRLYCQVFWIILEKKIPKIYEKLKKINIQDQLWLFQWFITLFFYNFSLDFSKRVWDFIISKKEFAPVLIALGIIRVLKNQLLEMKLQDQIDFLQYIEQFRDSKFCQAYLDLKKIFTFANSITKLQIDKAISQANCINNPYKIYFSSSLMSQKEQWHTLMKRLDNERYAFNVNPQPKKYERTVDVIQHLEKIVLSKYKLYYSEIKKSNGSFYRRSNFSIPFSIRSCKSANSQKKQIDFNKKKII